MALFDYEVSGFSWDDGNRDQCQKHGVSVAEVEALFESDIMLFPDVAHSGQEGRVIAVGTTPDGRNVLVVFTLRTLYGSTFVRPISARYMHRKEVEHFEKETAQIDK